MGSLSPKVKKHKWTIDEFLDSTRDHIGKLLDNMSPRDLIYIITFAFGVCYVYQKLDVVKKGISMVSNLPYLMVNQVVELLTGKRKFGQNIPADVPTEEKLEGENRLDWVQLSEAMLITYGLMKIDISDVSSGLTKITSVIGGLSS